MARTYASTRREIIYGRQRSYTSLLTVSIIFLFICSGFFMTDVHKRTRETLIEVLNKEREVMQTNNRLRTELAGITQTRFLELKAKERLGLEKPKEEEVLVLR